MGNFVESIDVDNSSAAYFAPATITAVKEILHVSGQVGTSTSGQAPADYESQIHLALLNLRKIIVKSKASITDILKLTLYIVNYDPARRLHTDILQKFLGNHRPAITLVPVTQLAAKDWLFEVEAVIAKRPAADAPSMQTATPPEKSFDVVVIGAGLAGLTAAQAVIKEGLSCRVLEARDRVGGRTFSERLPSGDGVIDQGAAWINDTNQSRMIALARRYGAELIEQNTTGNCVLQDHDGTLIHFPYGDLPNVGLGTNNQLKDGC